MLGSFLHSEQLKDPQDRRCPEPKAQAQRNILKLSQTGCREHVSTRPWSSCALRSGGSFMQYHVDGEVTI